MVNKTQTLEELGNNTLIREFMQKTSYDDIPFSASYDEQQLACLGSEWYSAVTPFNGCETRPSARRGGI